MKGSCRLRTANWLKNGCNGFDMKSPVSNPMSFWTEQDVLEYIYHSHIQIADVYGGVTADYGKSQPQGKSPNRWELAEKLSNPEIIDYMMRGGAFNEKGVWKPDNRGLYGQC